MESNLIVSMIFVLISALVIFLCSLQVHAYCESRSVIQKEAAVHDEYSLI